MHFDHNSPFSHVLSEIYSKTNEHYLDYKNKKDFPALYVLNKKETDESSIDNLLGNESEALKDKILNTAFAISDRLKIHEYFNYKMTYNWLHVKNKVLDQYYLEIGKYSGSERRLSSLENSLIDIDKHMLDEKEKCWQDLVKPMEYFTSLFGKYQELKQDKRLIG